MDADRVLVTQPPDKLDPLILSECENLILMKLSAALVLESCDALLASSDFSETPGEVQPQRSPKTGQ